MERRRRKISTGTPLTPLQSDVSSGGGTVPSTTPLAREIAVRPSCGFEVRDGDRLTVMYQGAKLQIAPYSTVELDGAIYSRTLQPGDDPIEQWDRIYSYLQNKSIEAARIKLGAFARELVEAKRITGGGR